MCLENDNLVECISIFLAIAGFIIAFIQFRLYRKELRNKVFIEFRQRFKNDAINRKIFEYLNNQNSNKPSKYEEYHFIGFYEELHKMYRDKQISIDDLIYFFGYYYIKFFDNHFLQNKNSLNDFYWTRAIDLYMLMNENKGKVLENISEKYNHKKNLSKI